MDVLASGLRPGVLSPMYLLQVSWLTCLILKVKTFESRIVAWLISLPRHFFKSGKYNSKWTVEFKSNYNDGYVQPQCPFWHTCTSIETVGL